MVDETGHGDLISQHDVQTVDFDRCVRREILDSRKNYPGLEKYSPKILSDGHGSSLSEHDAPQVDFRSCLPYSAIAHRQYIGSKKLDRVDYGRMGRDAPGDIYDTGKVCRLPILVKPLKEWVLCLLVSSTAPKSPQSYLILQATDLHFGNTDLRAGNGC